MVVVLAAAAPVGVIFVLLWWKTSGRWAAMNSKNSKAPDAEGTRVVVKNEQPRE